jgi:Cu(I)/Ag(I) efflux system membrane fusion protein
MISSIKNNYKLIIVAIFVGIFFGWLFFYSSEEATLVNPDTVSHEGHDHSAEESTIWTCSMHPQIKQNKPGKCPICAMDLIPLASMSVEGDDVDPYEIVMTESAAKLADIQSMVVSKGVPEKTIYLQGKVQSDERNVAVITARFGGRIEQLFVNFTGQNVRKGEKLATIYSPDLVTAQHELLEAVTFKESRPSLYKAVRNKLKLWDLTDKQISAIEVKGEPQYYFEILSPISGTVIMRHVAIGDYVKEGTTLFKVVDLSKIWVMFDAYESDLPWIKLGDKVDFTIQALPGKNFSAKVSYIDPFINAETRVAKVRVVVPNPKLNLKPEMFVNGLLESKIAETANEILVPKSSVLWTGKRAVVYVKVPDRQSPSFLYREVVLGPEVGSFFVVTEGLDEGEEIATNGVFKIDAAAQLVGFPSMMNPDGGKTSSAHNHGEGSMSDEEIKEIEETENGAIYYSKYVSDKFKKQLGDLIDVYLKMKDTFVAINENEVNLEAKKVLASLNNVDMTLLVGDAHISWMKLLANLESNLNGIISMNGIEMKRKHFSTVSDDLIDAIKKFGMPNKKAIYVQFCPMAFNNKGVYWLSDKKEIRNPYFGDKMLKCGEIKMEFTNK